MQGLGPQVHFGARTAERDIGIVDVDIGHRLHLIDRHGAGGGRRDQAEAGRSGQHLRVLDDAGLVTLTKDTAGQRSRTWVRITGKGRTALNREIEALKEMDNGNSRFVVVEGTIGQVRRTPLGVVLCIMLQITLVRIIARELANICPNVS